jgi:galactokinase
MEGDFNSIFGTPPQYELSVSARICVFGEHSDYVPYLNTEAVTFGSSEQRMKAFIRPRGDDKVKIVTTLSGLQENRHHSFHIRSLDMKGEWLDVLNSRGPPEPHWSNYVKGAVAYLANEPDTKKIDKGFEMLIDSNIPAASGASSSSALTVCGMVATFLANHMSFGGEEFAVEAGKAEWFVGTRGGCMDHATMCCAEEGMMLGIEFISDSLFTQLIPIREGAFAGDWKWYTIFTHPAEKSGAARGVFNELAFVQQEVIPSHLEGMDYYLPADTELIANKLPKTIEHTEFGRIRVRDRFRFVMNEYARVQKFSQWFWNDEGMIPLHEMRELLEGSWNDTRDLLGTHTPEMERVAAQLREKEGVLGVKVLGAGFGGNLLVCAKEDVDLGADAVEHTPGKGLQLIELD